MTSKAIELYKAPMKFCIHCKYYLPTTNLGKCRVFPTKENTTVDPITNTVSKVEYFEKYAACTLARSVETMCGPSAVYYTIPK